MRKWFAHDKRKWKEFKEKYKKELENKGQMLHKIKQIEKEKGIVTILYSAKDEEHNNAFALNYILKNYKELMKA